MQGGAPPSFCALLNTAPSSPNTQQQRSAAFKASPARAAVSRGALRVEANKKVLKKQQVRVRGAAPPPPTRVLPCARRQRLGERAA